MSWQRSRVSRQALGPAHPTEYRPAVVRSSAERTLLVETLDGDDRLLSAPASPGGNLIGATVLLADDDDWVVAVEPSDPVEQVVLTSGTTPPSDVDLRDRLGRSGTDRVG